MLEGWGKSEDQGKHRHTRSVTNLGPQQSFGSTNFIPRSTRSVPLKGSCSLLVRFIASISKIESSVVTLNTEAMISLKKMFSPQNSRIL